MDQKTIELTGIVRNLPDNRVADGTMQEIINLRPEDGAWRPVGPKESFPITASDIRFIHTINESFKVYLGTPGGSLWYFVYENGIIQASVSTGISFVGKQITFAQLHNTLIVSNVTDANMYIFVFDYDTERYRILDEGLPDVPDILIERDAGDLGTEDIEGSDVESYFANAVKIVADKMKRTFTGKVLLRFAWELSTGSVVKHSPIYKIKGSELTIAYSTSEYSSSISTVTWTGYHIVFDCLMDTSGRQTIIDNYRGIISALNIYMTRPNPVEMTSRSDREDTFGINDPVVSDENIFYLVQSIPLESLAEATTMDGVLANSGLDKDLTNIVTFNTMPTDNFTHHRLSGKSLFSYNDRIFLGDIVMRLYGGPNNALPTGGRRTTTGLPYEVGLIYELHTSEKTMHLFSGWKEMNSYKEDGTTPSFYFPFLFYPDVRAFQVKILTRWDDDIFLMATKYLTQSGINNFSYHDFFAVQVMPTEAYTMPNTTNTIYDPNRIQLTEQSNPFYYPAINSYRCGNGNVIGMATNAVALSSGQFGQFPVYVFTTDGIWALTIGSGDPLIQSIVPVSREVCNNARSITMIDGGVAFTTERGLYIISGASPVEISDLAEGSYLSRLTGTVNYEAIANNPNLYQVRAYLCNTSLLTYLQGAALGYDHIHKEIVATNPAKNYSWVFSLRSKMWFKISESFERFVQDFPRVYGYRSISTEGTTPFLASSTDISASDDTVLASAEYIEGTITYQLCDISQEDFTALVAVHMETRPLKITANKYKKINRLLIAGRVSDSIINPFSVNLFGSPDDKGWYLMNNGHAFGNKNRLLIGRSLFSCQYFILVFGGYVDEEAYFTHLEIEFEERFGGKLR